MLGVNDKRKTVAGTNPATVFLFTNLNPWFYSISTLCFTGDKMNVNS